MADEAVKKYLATTNRPYSANDIVMNLHKQFGKTAVQKALDVLVNANEVLEKTYGKQKVYVIKQDPNDCPSAEEIKELDDTLQKCDQEFKNVKDALKISETELEGLKNQIPLSDVLEKIENLSSDIDGFTLKLKNLSKNSVPISPSKLKKVKDDNLKIIKEFKLRRRLCMDMVNTILESYPKSKLELLEEIGIETDEEVAFPVKELIN